MPRKELPEIDERRCTGCGDCLEICPTECLVIYHSVPVVVQPQNCVSCTICAQICPEEAITMEWEHY